MLAIVSCRISSIPAPFLLVALAVVYEGLADLLETQDFHLCLLRLLPGVA